MQICEQCKKEISNDAFDYYWLQLEKKLKLICKYCKLNLDVKNQSEK